MAMALAHWSPVVWVVAVFVVGFLSCMNSIFIPSKRPQIHVLPITEYPRSPFPIRKTVHAEVPGRVVAGDGLIVLVLAAGNQPQVGNAAI